MAMSMIVECPSCKRRQKVGDELAGRYTLCDGCRCRFYAEVPPLGAPSADIPSNENCSQPSGTTIDDLLVDAQKGEAIIIRMLRRQNRLLVGLLLAIAMILAANVAMLWLV